MCFGLFLVCGFDCVFILVIVWVVGFRGFVGECLYDYVVDVCVLELMLVVVDEEGEEY